MKLGAFGSWAGLDWTPRNKGKVETPTACAMSVEGSRAVESNPLAKAHTGCEVLAGEQVARPGMS